MTSDDKPRMALDGYRVTNSNKPASVENARPNSITRGYQPVTSQAKPAAPTTGSGVKPAPATSKK